MVVLRPNISGSLEFNEDAYYTQWSSPSWKTARAEASRWTFEWKKFVHDAPAYPPERYSGRGIIVVAGGHYLEPALVLALRVRQMGFSDAIEVWHMGSEEIWPSALPLLKDLNVATKDFKDYVAEDQLEPIAANVGMRRFQLKPLAVMHSNLKEVLLLDADNIPLMNPAFLFDHPEFVEKGAIFWPDFWTTNLDNPIWSILEIESVQEWEQESGQLLINKEKSWKALHMCIHLNKEFYMGLLNGDKDTFRFAWKATHTPYHMVPVWPSTVGMKRKNHNLFVPQRICGHTMLQHAPNGIPLFMHHNQMKDLVLPIGENFQYVQDRVGSCRAVPSEGYRIKDKIVPCLDFELPGLRFFDEHMVLKTNLSHLEVFEYRYAAALRRVRTNMRVDRVRRGSAYSNIQYFYVNNGEAMELVTNCSQYQVSFSVPTNTTDRYCRNLSVSGNLTGNASSSLTELYFLDQQSNTNNSIYKYIFIQDQNSNQINLTSPILTLSASISYQFISLNSVSLALGLVITTSPHGGLGASALGGTEGVIDSPSFQGSTLVFRPNINLINQTIYYQSSSIADVGSEIFIVPPSWAKLQSKDNFAQRFNTAFDPASQLFTLSQNANNPSAAAIDLVLQSCQDMCASDPQIGDLCEGVFIFTTSSKITCFGLSDTGVSTRTILNSQSWFKVPKYSSPFL